MIRSPIIVVAGHVNHGKTILLDKIRGSFVAKSEEGELTQHVGASYIPIDTIKKICGDMLQKFHVDINIPGLLFIDTPGHAAFITIRKRGGAVSDLAILVIDITEGFQEQTDESLAVLKSFKVPFVVALTKIDKVSGWTPHDSCFLESFEKQRDAVKDELEKKLYMVVSQLSERGFNSERFDRVDNFQKQIAIVPCSGITGEGIADLLMVLAGLSQHFLKDKLEISKKARGTVLEVKDVKGFGMTMDVILYDGSIRKGDHIVIGGKQPVVAKIKALLRPQPLHELRLEKEFESVDEVVAAAGVKIAAPGLENVVPGSPVITVKTEKEVEKAKREIQKEVEEVQFTKQMEGVVAKADTLGSLEAMIKLLTEANIPIRKAEVGQVTKQDVTELQSSKDELMKVVLVFNVKTLDEIKNLAKDFGVKIFESGVIYRIIDEYKEWCLKKRERELQEKLESVARPCKVKFLPGCVFRQFDPAIFGVEVLQGMLKAGANMEREDGKVVGKIKEMQKEGKTIYEAKRGEKVAVSIDGPVVGRHIKESDILFSVISEADMKILKEVWEMLGEDEKELLSNK